MAPDQLDEEKTEENTAEAEQTDERMELKVEVSSPSACERHLAVTISRKDIERYLDDAFGEMMPNAVVPGFRNGRAPREVVENRFKKEVVEQIKGSLLMDSLSQVSEEQNFTAISEPDFDFEAVEVPDEGPMTFEFDIEVRPEFDMPEWKGLKIKRLKREFTDEDVNENLEQILSRYGKLEPSDEPAADGDYLTVNITSTADGEQVASEAETVVRVRPELSFVDGQLDGFGKLITGAKAGDKRSAELELTNDAPNEALRGKKVTVEFEILEVKKLKLPELTEDFLNEMGNFESEDALRKAIRMNLERQLEYQQQQKSRTQITELLTVSADWDLPPALLERQGTRELERAVMELRRSGFGEADIRARENELRQNSAASTATALKEHFILERIAEDENVDADEADYEKEIFLISSQSGESPRRVRAQLEKRGMMDALRNQIIERKVLEIVQGEAKFEDESYEPEQTAAEAIHVAAGGAGESAIPDATVAESTDEDAAESKESKEEAE